MGKFTFNTSIGMDMKAASADSFVDNIQMIEFSEIKQNKDNFYTLSELELLADDIERQGLKHNLVVCKDSTGSGYWLISGHRRYSAIKLLIEQNRLKSTLVPCYVDGERTQAEAMLNLIMLNATQRKYTDAETMAEYEMLKQTIQQLEDEGKPVKGRIREIIAKTLNVSPAQVGKIENIRNNAIDEVHEAVKNGEMSISTANEVAKLNPAKQQEIISSKPTAEITHKEVKQLREQEKEPEPEPENDDIIDTAPDTPEEPYNDPDDTDEYPEESELEEPEDTEDIEVKPEKETLQPTALANVPTKTTATLSLTADEVLALSDWLDENAYITPSSDREIYELSEKLSAFLKEHGIVS